MAGYLDTFMQNYAAIAAPLHQLTRKETRRTRRGSIQKDTGLSASLLQKTDRGIHPVHFISRAMTETERCYSQTKKDALAIKWAKERLRINLLGAPRFGIVTAHKSLVPFFHKLKDKVPPRIEKWIMEM